MQFELDQALPVLARTPNVLRELLAGLPGVWIVATEGPDSWSPYDIVGHLIHGERTDWLLRAEIILQEGESRPFPTFDRFAQFEASRGKTIEELLDTFAELRAANLDRLRALGLACGTTWAGAVCIPSWAPSAWNSIWRRGWPTT